MAEAEACDHGRPQRLLRYRSSDRGGADPCRNLFLHLRCRLVRLQLRRSEEHTSELQSPCNLVCRLLLEKKKNINQPSQDKQHTINHQVSTVRLSARYRKVAHHLPSSSTRCLEVAPHLPPHMALLHHGHV